MRLSAAFASASVAGALLLAACGGGDEASPTATGAQSTPGAAGTRTPEAVIAGPGEFIVRAGEPVAFDFAPDGRLFYTTRQAGEIRTVPLARPIGVETGDASLAPVVAARDDLSRRLGEAADQIQLLSVAPRQWPDACLGAAQAGEVCAQVLTAGYEVVLGLAPNTSTYVYHTDEGTSVRFVSLDIASEGGNLFATVDTFVGTECGLLGIAVDPEFSANHYVYVYVTQPVAGQPDVAKPRVIRFTDAGGVGTDPTVIVDDLPLTNPKGCLHVGGNLHFGPDGYLYLSIGNNELLDAAADLSSPLGKLLRFNKADGSPAPDNPFVGQAGADGRVFAYGMRNPWDFTFDAESGIIYAGDNGPGNCDELNVIVRGADYGVPRSLPDQEAETCLGLGGVEPIYLFARPGMEPQTFGSNIAPAGLAFLSGSRYPGLGKGVLVCTFNTQTLHLLELAGPEQVARNVVLRDDCLYNVEVSPEGFIFYSKGGAIFRLLPESLAGPGTPRPGTP